MYINIDRFDGEIKARDPKYFRCANPKCNTTIEEGDEFYEGGYCLICGSGMAEIKICTEEDCEE